MNKGFTLIEVLLCLLLFGVAMLGALASQVYARQQVLLATQRLLATAMVMDVAASLQSVPAAAPSFQGSFDKAPASVALCQDVAQCDAEQLLQAQVQQQLSVMLSDSASGLPSAQLCIVAGADQPEIQLSWRGVTPSKFPAKSTLCPLPTGFSHVALRAGGDIDMPQNHVHISRTVRNIHTFHPHCRGRNGWTLIEAMISMALGLLCTLLLIAGWQWNYRAFIQTTQLSELQQSAQFVLSFMQQELVNQNFWAGFQLSQLPPTSLATPTADCAGPIDSGSFPKLQQGFVGIYSGTVGDSGTPGCLTVARKGSDFLQLKRLAGAPARKAELKSNRIYLQQYQRYASFVALHSPELYAAATYWPYVHQLWYVALQKHEGKNIPVLMRKRLVRQLSGQLAMDTSAVIDGVEMLHFELGVDSNFDGQMDYSKPAAQMPDTVWLGQSGKIIQLRFYVLLRSITADLTYTNVQQYQLGQRQYKAPGDHYRRLLVSSAVTLTTFNSQE